MSQTHCNDGKLKETETVTECRINHFIHPSKTFVSKQLIKSFLELLSCNQHHAHSCSSLHIWHHKDVMKPAATFDSSHHKYSKRLNRKVEVQLVT